MSRSSSIGRDATANPGDRAKLGASELLFKSGPAETDAARSLVEAHHYSRCMPQGMVMAGVWYYLDAPVAACAFGVPTSRWAEPVMELKRLVARPEYSVPLTRLISLTTGALRAACPETDLLISYADWTMGHHGGVYQAASWRFGGMRKPAMDGLIVDGQYVAGRTCTRRWGTRSPTKLRVLHPDWAVEPHFDKGKCLYWRALSRIGQAKAARVRLADLPYPKLLRTTDAV